MNLAVTKMKGRGEIDWEFERHVYTTVLKIDN